MPQAQYSRSRPATAPGHGQSDDPLLALVLQSLDDDQAQEVVTIP